MSDGTIVRRPADERRQQILDVTCELICLNGAHGVTLSAIAERIGVSRQWLYTVYSDLDDIYLAIYAEARQRFLIEPVTVPRDADELGELIKGHCREYLDIPPACAVLSLSALHGGRRRTKLERGLRDAIYANVRRTWVDPLVAVGYDEGEVMDTVIAFASIMFGLVVNVHRGLTTPEFAYQRLIRVVDGLIGSWSPPVPVS